MMQPFCISTVFHLVGVTWNAISILGCEMGMCSTFDFVVAVLRKRSITYHIPRLTVSIPPRSSPPRMMILSSSWHDDDDEFSTDEDVATTTEDVKACAATTATQKKHNNNMPRICPTTFLIFYYASTGLVYLYNIIWLDIQFPHTTPLHKRR